MKRADIAIHVIAVIALFTASVLPAATPEQRAALDGVWTGTSICTNVRPACHDEKAIYRITSKPGGDNLVEVSADKVVDGKEVVMGVISFHADYQRRIITSELMNSGDRFLWTFTWQGKRMTGTLKQLPAGDVIRNIDLNKQ
ncbi:MAG: hypothetical protein QOK37_395 [Thermoanaerobaculia bacterium]|jgi:hypothetical protein|nr:hypothetical protein [Thermoanaerobaculia bacterium]